MGRNYGKNVVITTNNRGDRHSYNQHDERGWQKESKRHVSFNDKRGGFIRKKKSRAPPSSSAIIFDDDERMDGNDGSSGTSYRNQAGRSRAPGGSIRGARGGKYRNRGGGTVHISSSFVRRGSAGAIGKSWHKVTLNHGAKYPKTDLLSALASACTVTFKPIYFHKAGLHNIFYVETRELAIALKSLDQKLTMPDSFKLGIRVETSAPPQMTITEEIVDKLKVVMSSRYTASTRALDLKQFHADNAFLGDSVYAPLNRSVIIEKIIKIIGENIPEVEAIDMSNNRLPTLDYFTVLAKVAPNVQVLYLSDNRIYEMSELEKCKSWKLVNLKLDGNPMATRFKDTTAYQSAIRKKFPSLKYLDGKELPKLITFDDDDVNDSSELRTLPPSIQKMACNDQAGSIVLQFLEQYIRIYDSDDRQSLMDAYHEKAVMSLSSAYPVNVTVHGSKKLEDYVMESRNLFRVTDSNRRSKLLRRGRLAIVSFLNGLPKTLHDPNSITLDLPFATERLMTFTVTGLFKERGKRDEVVRHFNRMFVVIPQGTGFVIINEFLFVTNPTPKQTKESFSGVAIPTSPSTPSTPEPDISRKQMLATEVSQKTGMTLDWSVKCLEQTSWELQRALSAFETAKSEGKIPPEAFQR